MKSGPKQLIGLLLIQHTNGSLHREGVLEYSPHPPGSQVINTRSITRFLHPSLDATHGKQVGVSKKTKIKQKMKTPEHPQGGSLFRQPSTPSSEEAVGLFVVPGSHTGVKRLDIDCFIHVI